MNSDGLAMDMAKQEKGEFQRTVMRAFRLDPVSRDIYLLCDIQGFTSREVAFVLGMSLGEITARLDHARRDMNSEYME
jgi:DNA-directed RNA polymerase specialized sigma24 family protein